MDSDVAVVGGGPVGAALAMLLARGGHSVTVIEKAALPRDKPCGEGLMPSGVQVLGRLGIDLIAEGFPAVHGVRYRLANGRSVRGDLRAGPGCGVRRLRFDPLLAARAAATPGVDFVAGCAALGVRMSGECARIDTQRGEVRVRVIIGADGLRSGVARWLGLARRPQDAGRPPRHALVGHWTLEGRPIADEIVITLLAGVEVYAAPAGPRELLVAVLGPRGALRQPGLDVAGSYRTVVERAHPELAGETHAGRVWGAGPFRTWPRTVAVGRAFLVGDAAGFLDPLTGDGIAAGLAQAEALGRLLTGGADLAARSEVEAAAVSYRASWARQWRRRRTVTGLALALTGSTALARRALAGVTRRPAALQAMLEVNDGTRGFGSLGPRDWAALAGF